MKVLFYRYMLAAFTTASLAFSGSALAQVDLAKSSVTATSKQMNVPVEGKFKKFSAQISFDPAKPATGSAQLNVDVGSYDLGDESYNEQVRGSDWFDAKRFPSATFVSSAIAPVGGNQYKVTGKLTLKGKTQTVVVPVTVTQQGATQTFDGALPVKRSQFDIGTGEWKDTAVVADEVVIKFHIVAAHK
ncbi:YceI family protein [Paraburkholderia bonniea]|uniref:YceI family protein n=1 Tax=Paraburkholderia bonniea TaxID=2152891 RepID=UPI001291F3CA|nr:YceI family protein [Paraburkholderia bonniea]WJF89807.1 YceI family protein [Paraburkholderia bonniea]WJF93121.1 YceI family protein [Paraburkholderia bonniea]